MAARRGRGGFRRPRGPKNNAWSILIVEEQAVSTVAIEADVVNSGEWESGSSFERATLLRLRGNLSVSMPKTNTTINTIFLAIYLVDLNAGVKAPNTVAFYTDEDVLWSTAVLFQAGVAGSLEVPPTVQIPVDIKSMRKMTSGTEIRLTMISTTAAQNINVSGVLRGLIRMGGN